MSAEVSDIYLHIEPAHVTPLPPMGGRQPTPHVFCKGSIDAVNAALAARRPLLVRGEPGMGKSQLARAVAFELKRAFVSIVVDAHTEPRDLRYRFDAIRRLAKAQVAAFERATDVADPIAERHFITPGPLWWAFQWKSAAAHAQEMQAGLPWFVGRDDDPPGVFDTRRGCVVLIDEIDKADPSVPNGLLEVLGEGRFDVPGIADPVCLDDEVQARPLILVTTNEERRLPDAFLRRCLVLHLRPPDELVDWLSARGAQHFERVDESIRREAAEDLARDRAFAEDNGLPAPGQAEYLDLLRAIDSLAEEPKQQREYFRRLRDYAYRKHPVAWPSRDDEDCAE